MSLATDPVWESALEEPDAGESLGERHSVGGGGPVLRYRVDKEALRALTRVDVRLSLAHIALEWFLWLGAAAIHARWLPLWTYPLTCMFIGARLHALGILAHDGAHFLLARNRTVNDVLAEALLAWPVGLSLPTYRALHIDHHRYLNTPRDPDWRRNRPDRMRDCGSWRKLCALLLGLQREQLDLLRMVGAPRVPVESSGDARTPADTSSQPVFPPWRLPLRLALASLVAAIAFAGAWRVLLVYWVVPLATWFLLSMRIKGVAEHSALDERERCRQARTLTPGWWVRTFIAPKSVHYHIEHHLFPSVPCYRLKSLHHLLMNDPHYAAHAHITPSYPAFIRECLRYARLSLSHTDPLRPG